VVWVPAVFVSRKLSSRGDFWKIALKNSPAWVRYAIYGFLGYAMFNFLIFFVNSPREHTGADPPAVVWRGFSGHWMAFYSAAFAILYSAATAQVDRWRCPNGHSVEADAPKCGLCGLPRSTWRHRATSPATIRAFNRRFL
jgi:hypothetical protein